MKPLLPTLALLLIAATAPAQNTPLSQMEYLDRGVIALRAASSGNFVSWRFLGTDDEDNTRFDVLRNGIVVATDLYKTNYLDKGAPTVATYQIVTKVGGEVTETSEPVASWGSTFKKLILNRPADGPNGGTYDPNDCSVGDVDGDGQYELFVKWYPSNAKDNSQGGITDNTIIDCYKLVDNETDDIDWEDDIFTQPTNCELLWRIDLGRNIRSGAHYTQFMVYDFDGDGHAEMMCKTAPGSIDGVGKYVNEVATDESIKKISGTALYRSSDGRITGGQEWLTVFNGLTGEAIHTIFYNPNRNMTYGGAADGSVNWGVGGKNDTGSYGNRGERYLAAVASLGGPDSNPSAIFSRGYYDYAFIWAVDFDGQLLHQRWFSSHKSGSAYTVTTYDADGNGTTKSYSGCKPTSGSGSGTMYQNGNHNLSIGDVDGDGCDEIIWGSAALNNDGTLLYGTGFGHGDAIHLADHCPDRPGLEVFQIHESGSYGWDLHDALTGEIIHSDTGGKDNGRGIAGNFDSKTRGSLFWSANDGQPRSAITGNVVYNTGGSQNFRIYWDGDLQDELLDGSTIDKFKNGVGGTNRLATLYNIGPGSTCNGSKNTPCLQADLFGDWREEVILYGIEGSEACLAIYSTTTETKYRMPTLMHDHTYRMGICWQNTAYNQPPHLGYYVPDAMMPRILNDEKTVSTSVGEPFCYTAISRYASLVATSKHITPDGKTVNGMPEGIENTVDYTYKTVTYEGAFTQPGTYQLLITLSGYGAESVTDTITVNVQEASGIADVSDNSTLNPQNASLYDLQGRRLSNNRLRKGLYIDHQRRIVFGR